MNTFGSRARTFPDDGVSRRRDTFMSWIALAVVGVAICGVSLWQTWGVVPWVIGAGLLGLALIGLAREGSEHRWVTVVAAVVGVAAVSFPFVLPYLGQSVPVQWSVDGEWALESSGDLVVTVTVDPDNPSPGDDGVAHMRARTAASGDVVWSREVSAEDYEDLPGAWVHEASGVLVAWVATDPGYAWEYRAIDVETGDDLWTAPAASTPGMVSTSGDLLIVENDSRVEGWDARTGEVRWSEEADFSGPPLRPYYSFHEVDYVGLRVPVPEGEPGDDVTIRVLEAKSGEQHGELGLPPNTMAAVVGDRLLVDDGLTAAAADREIGDTDYQVVTVTSYALPALDEMWSAELTRPRVIDEFDQDPFGTGHTHTVTQEGVLELLAPADGTVSRIPPPRDVRLVSSQRYGYPVMAEVHWSGGRNAIMLDVGHSEAALVPAAYVDIDGGTARTVRVPQWPPEVSLSRAGDLDPAPLWRTAEDDVFGRDSPHALVVDDADGKLALRDLGALPRDAGSVDAHADMLFTRTDDRLHAIDPGAVR